MTIIHVVTQYEPRVQCETPALTMEQLLLPAANSLLFLLLPALLLPLTHALIQMDPNPRSHSTLSFVSFFSPPAPFHFVFFFLLRHASARIGPLLGSVPPSWPPPSHLLMMILSLGCLPLTNNDQQPVYLCQGKECKKN